MRAFILAGTSLLALSASRTGASAAPITFSYTGSLVSYTVPVTGLYDIVAIGAQGGGAFQQNQKSPYQAIFFAGGLGAEIGGDFLLTAGETLSIAVGGGGSSGNMTNRNSGGGGGGSFVVGPGSTPLVIAGGGGGSSFSEDGGNAQTSMAGAAGNFAGGTEGTGGTGGGGGGAGHGYVPGVGFGGSGGGGFYGQGKTSSYDNANDLTSQSLAGGRTLA